MLFKKSSVSCRHYIKDTLIYTREIFYILLTLSLNASRLLLLPHTFFSSHGMQHKYLQVFQYFLVHFPCTSYTHSTPAQLLEELCNNTEHITSHKHTMKPWIWTEVWSFGYTECNECVLSFGSNSEFTALKLPFCINPWANFHCIFCSLFSIILLLVKLSLHLYYLLMQLITSFCLEFLFW